MSGYQSKKLMAQSREDDLVKRLDAEINVTYGKHPCGLLNEAKNRIEQLEAALRYVEDNIYPDNYGNYTLTTDFNLAVFDDVLPEEKKNETKIKTEFLSIRAKNVLNAEKIDTLEKLAAYGERPILRIPNLGRKTLKELKNLLKDHGMVFVDDNGRKLDGRYNIPPNGYAGDWK
jgi:DNA-directed RNA polymerase alpha subunit